MDVIDEGVVEECIEWFGVVGPGGSVFGDVDALEDGLVVEASDVGGAVLVACGCVAGEGDGGMDLALKEGEVGGRDRELPFDLGAVVAGFGLFFCEEVLVDGAGDEGFEDFASALLDLDGLLVEAFDVGSGVGLGAVEKLGDHGAQVAAAVGFELDLSVVLDDLVLDVGGWDVAHVAGCSSFVASGADEVVVGSAMALVL